MRVADDPEMWQEYYSDFRPFPDHRYPPVLIPYMEGYPYRPSPMLKTDGDEMLEASTRAKPSCPFWIPRVVVAGMTPEIARTPRGDALTPQPHRLVFLGQLCFLKALGGEKKDKDFFVL